MRFVCDSCRAQYMISDDKVGAKGVKVRCKKCGHNIVVRSSGAAPAKEAGAVPSNGASSTAQAESSRNESYGLPATLGTPPEGGLLSDIADDEIGAVFDQVLSSGPHKIPAGEMTGDGPSQLDASDLTSDASETVRKLAEAEAEGGKPGAAAHEWFVAIDEKQVGPLTLEKVKDHWERGEVGPDSLCWRAGFSDWIPLSEATELASVLAPRPSKPVLVMPAMVETPAPVASAPVESAFSAGGLSRTRTSELPLSSAPVVEEPSGWKPSAASVLASLVKEENEALAKPPPKLAPVVEEKPALAMGGLLDVPPPEPAPVARPSPMMAATPAPVAPYQPPAPAYAPPAQAYAPPPPQGYAPPVQQYAAPPQPYPPAAYPAYPPPAAPAPKQSKMGLIVALAAVGLIAVSGGVFVMTRPPAGGPGTAPVAGTQPVTPPPTLVAEAPTASPKPAEVPAAQPATAGTVQNPPTAAAQPAVAPAPVEPPPAQPAAAPANNGAVAAAANPAPTTPPPAEPAQPAVAPAKSEPIARAEPAEASKSGTRRPAARPTSRTEDDEESRTARRPRPAEESRGGGADDEFDELFGPKKTTPKPESGARSPSAYIPPEPGGGGNVQEKLGQSDIMQVVLANKPAIVKCVSEQKKKDPGLSGKLVMRWTIQTNGKTKNVSCQTSEFRSTYMATCITGLIKGWSFPKHKVQGQPIDFPFTF
jgi:predicted Zn finger-like uncharacterized protein